MQSISLRSIEFAVKIPAKRKHFRKIRLYSNIVPHFFHIINKYFIFFSILFRLFYGKYRKKHTKTIELGRMRRADLFAQKISFERRFRQQKNKPILRLSATKKSVCFFRILTYFIFLVLPMTTYARPHDASRQAGRFSRLPAWMLQTRGRSDAHR